MYRLNYRGCILIMTLETSCGLSRNPHFPITLKPISIVYSFSSVRRCRDCSSLCDRIDNEWVYPGEVEDIRCMVGQSDGHSVSHRLCLDLRGVHLMQRNVISWCERCLWEQVC